MEINKTENRKSMKAKVINQTDEDEKEMINIRNERSDISIHSTDFTKRIREYCKQLYVKKLNNVVEIDKFLERYNQNKKEMT